jgi:hypothetical protein
VAVDTGHSNAIPTITVSDADETSKEEHAQTTPEETTPSTLISPGELPAGLAPAIPDWYKVGWRQVGGIDADPITAGVHKDRSVLDMFLNEQFYGYWYYNAAIVIFVRRWVYFALKRLLTLSISTGCICISLPYPLWLWLGMAVHYPRLLQHLLRYVNGACAAQST